MHKRRHKTGFTLIELLVVITIIAILGGLGIASFRQANQSARDGKRAADMESLRQALILYRQEADCFPAGTPAGMQYLNGLTSVENALVNDYINEIPTDPSHDVSSTTRYRYQRVGPSACPTGFILRYRDETDGAWVDITYP